jgi:hypothetical protein
VRFSDVGHTYQLLALARQVIQIIDAAGQHNGQMRLVIMRKIAQFRYCTLRQEPVGIRQELKSETVFLS